MRGALVRFFLRTFFFRPANHPVLPFAVILILFFYALHSIDRTHVGLIVYASVLAHGVVGGLFRRDENGAITSTSRFFGNLPVSRQTVVRSYLAAACMYALVSLLVLGAILGYFVKLPGWQSLEVTDGVDEMGYPALIVRGFDRDARGFLHAESMVLPRSYLVETLRQAGKSRPLFAAYFVAMMVYLAAWHLYREARSVSPGRRALAIVPLALYAGVGASLVAEYFVAPATLHRWYQEIPAREHEIVAVLLMLTGITGIMALGIAHEVPPRG